MSKTKLINLEITLSWGRLLQKIDKFDKESIKCRYETAIRETIDDCFIIKGFKLKWGSRRGISFDEIVVGDTHQPKSSSSLNIIECRAVIACIHDMDKIIRKSLVKELGETK